MNISLVLKCKWPCCSAYYNNLYANLPQLIHWLSPIDQYIVYSARVSMSKCVHIKHHQIRVNITKNSQYGWLHCNVCIVIELLDLSQIWQAHLQKYCRCASQIWDKSNNCVCHCCFVFCMIFQCFASTGRVKPISRPMCKWQPGFLGTWGSVQQCEIHLNLIFCKD